MGTLRNEKNGAEEDTNDFTKTTMYLLWTIADTTWRLFIPSVGLLLVGVWLDQMYATKPWFMIAGLVIGVAVAFWLVKLQLNRKV